MVHSAPPRLTTREIAAVAIDSEGDFVVAWESYGQGGTASSLATILAQRVNSGGTLIGPTQFLPSTQSGDSQTAPKIASNADGNAIFVWQSKPSSTSDSQNVYGRLYDYVNDAPTINTPSNVTINENAGQQTVNLTGITAGGGETQTLTVTASSNNTSLIATPTITYTSPNSTGTLTFTPAANSFGTATITVTVMDNGGTANGGVDTTSVQFTVTVNQVVIPPTINTPSNVTIDENAGQQTVDLTGITSGGAGDVTLTVTASSNNTALINPTVNYTSPNSTGTLTFTPAANQLRDGHHHRDRVGRRRSEHDQRAFHRDGESGRRHRDRRLGRLGHRRHHRAANAVAGRLLPAGRTTDLPWYGINKLQITLSQPESLSPGDVSVTGITVANLRTGDDLRLRDELHHHVRPGDHDGRSRDRDHRQCGDHDVHPAARRPARRRRTTMAWSMPRTLWSSATTLRPRAPSTTSSTTSTATVSSMSTTPTWSVASSARNFQLAPA